MAVIKKIVRVALLILVYTNAFSQGYLEFIENKGQWDKQVKFKGDVGSGAFLLQSTGYRVALYNKNDLSRIREAMHPGHPATQNPQNKVNAVSKAVLADDPGSSSTATGSTLRGHIYEMRFLNAIKTRLFFLINRRIRFPIISSVMIQPNGQVIAALSRELRIKMYIPVLMCVINTANGVLKYDIIVNPGGDVANIAMYFDGVDELKVKDKALHIKTSVDEVVEMAPYTYQLINGSRTEIPCSFDVKGNIVRFRLSGVYSTRSTLVIDPSLVFSTFTGSRADNWGYTATFDGAGNFYAGGIVFNNPSNGFR